MLKIARHVFLYVGIALTLMIALYSLRYLFGGAASVLALAETDAMLEYLSGQQSSFWHEFSVRQQPLYQSSEFAVVGHITAASVALIAGIIQFLPVVRQKAPLLHRASGYFYAFTATLGLGLGAYISFSLPMIGGTNTIISNIVGGILGISFVGIAFYHIWKKHYLQHGQWMLRSYAVLLAILTVYLLVAFFALLGVEAERGYALAHMLCFPINLAVVELFIRRSASGKLVLAYE